MNRLVDMGEVPPIGKRTLEEILERLIRLERKVERLDRIHQSPVGEFSEPDSTATVPLKCLKCDDPAADLSNYCREHFPTQGAVGAP